jgi:hypothetical protein
MNFDPNTLQMNINALGLFQIKRVHMFTAKIG